jgi:uncharacterized protein (TIGR03000 family)
VKKFVALVALSLVAAFAALPSPADACWRGSYYYGGPRTVVLADYGPGTIVVGRTFYGPYDTWYTSRGLFGWRRTAYFQPYTVAYSYPVVGTSSMAFYPPTQDGTANAATIGMQVPSGARVWFDGQATTQTGSDRTFVTPSLTPGSEYVYRIRVQWNENGQAVERTREVTVHAGDRIQVNVQS